MGVINVVRLYQLDQANLLGYAVEAASLHYFAAHRGEESLLLAREVMVENIAYYGLDDCIS